MRSRTTICHILLSIAMISHLPSSGLLARLRPMALSELSNRSSEVAVVRCVKKSTIRIGNGQMIFTVYRFERLAGIRGGQLSDSFSLRIAGGQIGSRRVVLHDTARFETGKSYAVFLKKMKSADDWIVTGSTQGVLPAKPDAQTGGWKIQIPASSGGIPDKQKAASNRSWISLAEFQSILDAAGGGQ